MDSRELKVSVTNLLKRVFTKERFSAYLDVGISDEGLYERGGGGNLGVECWLESSPDGIRVKGKISGKVGMQCTRCLKEYSRELDIDVDEFFMRPGLTQVDEDGLKLNLDSETGEEDDYIIEEGVIDLNVLVNDAVMLSLPMRCLCREDCKGLCQVCGINLNEGECGCEVSDIDPRLEVLRTLLDQDDS